MASVTSLDKDLRNMRLSRYTPQAAAEVRSWIEEVLRERLAPGDLLEALKDGVALCRLLNLAVSPGVKYKQSSMPFVQMENISHFLRACQLPPLSLPPHDVFLTVDLYESKDPAQVLQCIASFSRRAYAIQPGKFPRAIGVQSKASALSPSVTGSSQGPYTPPRNRGLSDVNSPASGRSSPGKSPSAAVSSWSKRTDEHVTQPAWNIHQYGYMGGASQANQGVAFGARRQITTASPYVPSVAEKENRRREEETRSRREREEAEYALRAEREAEETRAQAEEERRWAEEATRLKEIERRDAEEERRRWGEEQRRWEEEDQFRAREEKEAEERFEQERQRRREANDTRLNGQFLSQYQATQAAPSPPSPVESQESQRIKELERELELAKERERQYEAERQPPAAKISKPTETRNRPVPVPPKPSYDLSSLESERRLLRGEWENHQDSVAEVETPPPMPPRPLPDPTAIPSAKPQASENRVDRFLSSNPAPLPPRPAAHRPQDFTSTSEVDAENSRRAASQQKTKAGGWASKTLLEREMERERERQREWEEGQKQTQEAASRGLKDPSQGAGPGGAWDVHQYGFMGGDNQNKGGHGLGIGGARRQIIGPRPPR
ncbi:hypothetical protein BJX99DRAFT_221446 [Aspergillus californicus]